MFDCFVLELRLLLYLIAYLHALVLPGVYGFKCLIVMFLSNETVIVLAFGLVACHLLFRSFLFKYYSIEKYWNCNVYSSIAMFNLVGLEFLLINRLEFFSIDGIELNLNLFSSSSSNIFFGLDKHLAEPSLINIWVSVSKNKIIFSKILEY